MVPLHTRKTSSFDFVSVLALMSFECPQRPRDNSLGKKEAFPRFELWTLGLWVSLSFFLFIGRPILLVFRRFLS